jgi:preprotein translocase subunit SecA
VVTAQSTRGQRRQAYACDVTYTTVKEIGFDFLRDRLAQRQALEGNDRLAAWTGRSGGDSHSPVLRPLNALIVDEADSILIDEARTPLVVSASPAVAASTDGALYAWAAQHAGEFGDTEHLETDPRSPIARLNHRGRQRVRRLPLPHAVQDTPVERLYEFIQRAILVQRQYCRDRHYVVRDGAVVIVDEYTGRLAEGRQWRGGLHQAIEAREGLAASSIAGDAARITIQNLCRQYRRLSGMTGTVESSAKELKAIYGLTSVDVPTHRPVIRQRWPAQIYPTDTAKWVAIVAEVASVRRQGRPVLVGTRSIEYSERLSVLLAEAGIQHQVLNARHLAREAEMIAAAGCEGCVTVATNMAGRGTDIQLSEQARRHGGLHVIVSELHDAARIDRQLVGRCGRQGDPGSYRQFLSLEDEILAHGLSPATRRRLPAQTTGSPRQLARWARWFAVAQRRIERAHFQGRQMLLYREQWRQQLQREMGQDPYLDTAES